MNAHCFDQFVRALNAASGPRRGLLRWLLALLLSGSFAWRHDDAVDAKGRRKRRKKRHKHGRPRRHGERKRKSHKRCRSQSQATTCAGKCGPVKNNCRKTVDCGSCICDPPCPVCQVCDGATGLCEPNPDTIGDPCGEPGQVCQGDGSCACADESCAACQTCASDGFCSDPCDGSGCCDGLSCQPGTANAACGAGGTACTVCGDATPFCVTGACASIACASNRQCPSGALCDDSVCRPCTVCAAGCSFTSVQAAIAAASAGDTVIVCAGDYTGNLTIAKALTLIGAGDGVGAGDTILRGTGAGTAVSVTGASVSLQRLRISGGKAGVGGGIRNSGTLALSACTITGNTADPFSGGGIANDEGATLTLDTCTVSGNTASGINGGGIDNAGNMTLIGSTVSGNTANANGGGIYNSCTLGKTCSLKLEASTISGNTASFNGGGIYNNPQATVILDAQSRVTGNNADPTDADSGGGIFNDGGALNLADEQNVTGNTPDNCGGDDLPPLCVG